MSLRKMLHLSDGAEEAPKSELFSEPVKANSTVCLLKVTSSDSRCRSAMQALLNSHKMTLTLTDEIFSNDFEE